jgi:ribosomal protein L29
MKTYKMADLLKKDQKTLNEDLAKLKTELNQIRVKGLSKKSSDDTSGAGKVRKQIARIQTALNQPEPVKKTAKAKKEQDK